MRKSCFIPSLSPPQISPNSIRYSTDMSDQYSQIAQFLTNILQDVNNSDSKQPSLFPSKPANRNILNLPLEEGLQSSRRKSSVLRNLKAPLPLKNKSMEKSRFAQSKKKGANNSKTDIKVEPEPKKVVYKRFMSSSELETNSQDLFSSAPTEKPKKEISQKTLKVLL